MSHTAVNLPSFVVITINAFARALDARAQVIGAYGAERGSFELEGSAVASNLRKAVGAVRKVMAAAPNAEARAEVLRRLREAARAAREARIAFAQGAAALR